jgi:hypothetical protein
MYCPQCSQEQIAEDMRFCSRCGFPLVVVSQLVANGGVLAGVGSEGKRHLSPRQKGIRWGALLLITSGVLLPIVALMTAMESDFFVLFIPVLVVFLIGLIRLLHAYLLAQKTPHEIQSSSPTRSRALAAARTSALPAGPQSPITTWRQPVNTAEMARPSITEHTTRLLDDEK